MNFVPTALSIYYLTLKTVTPIPLLKYSNSMTYMKQLIIEINILKYIHDESANATYRKYGQYAETKVFLNDIIISQQRYSDNEVELHPI